MSRNEKIKFDKSIDAELFPEDAPLKDTKGAKLLTAIEREPTPPCVDRGDRRPCEHFYRCATERTACRAFFAYTREYDNRKEYGQWLQMERKPTAHMYNKTYRATE